MEFKRSLLHDPIEIIIPLIDPDTGDFVTADVLLDGDIKVYYWDKSEVTPKYIERAFSGVHELVVPLNGTVYLHRIAFDRSMFDGADEVDLTKPIGVAIIDQSVTKVFKDTGFDIKLSPEIKIDITTMAVNDIPDTGNKAIKITAYVYDCDGVISDPLNKDIMLRAYMIIGTSEGVSDDFYKESSLSNVADNSGLGNGKKMVAGEPGEYTIYFKVPDSFTERHIQFFAYTMPGILDSDYGVSRAVHTFLSDVSSKVDASLIAYDAGSGVAKQSSVESIQNNTRCVVGLPTRFNIPQTGDEAYKITVNFYDTDGNMEDPDDNEFSISMTNHAGGDMSDRLYKEAGLSNALDASVKFGGIYKALEKEDPGRYFCFVKVANSEVETQLMYDFACEENSVALHYTRSNLMGAADIDAVILEDSDPNKLVIVKAIKQYIASGVNPSADSIYDDLIQKINDVPQELVDKHQDGVPIGTIFELVMAMVDGRLVKDVPNVGDITIMKRDNATILTITRTTTSERTRL